MFNPYPEFSARVIGGVLIAGVLYALAVLYLLYGVDRADTQALLTAAIVAGIGYGAGVIAFSRFRRYGAPAMSARPRQPSDVVGGIGFALGLALRIAAVFAFPALSDDIFRFLWDGGLWWAGISPFAETPIGLSLTQPGAPLDEGAAFAKTHGELLVAMNSSGYHTVYPPMSQLAFALAGWVPSVYWGGVVLKAVLLLGELGIWSTLKRLLPNRERARTIQLLYWLNPLVIVELTGNAHFEGLAVLFVLLSLLALRRGYAAAAGEPRPAPPARIGLGYAALAGGALCLAALVKLVPLVFAPALALYILWTRGRSWHWVPAIGFGVSLMLPFLAVMAVTLVGGGVAGFGESLDLYFRNFEFNGSLYNVGRAVGLWYKGWNWIAVVGPGLSLLGALSILVVSAYRTWRGLELATTLLYCGAAYLACATTVHPWYFVYLVGVGVLTPYRWPLLLSCTAFLSYAAYAKTDVAVPVWALLLEYVPVLALAVYEVLTLRRSSNEPPQLAQ